MKRPTITGMGLLIVAGGLIVDSPEKRAQFKTLTAGQIAKLYRDERVTEHLEDEEPEDFLA